MEMVSEYSKYPREALLKVSSRSNIRKLVKTPPILQVSSWSLGGKECSWWSWRWCQSTQNTPGKLYWKFHQDPTSGSLSRLHLSSKSLPGVLVERDVLDGAGEVSWYSKYPREASLKVSSRYIIRKLAKTTNIIKVSSWSLGGLGGSWWTWRWWRGV